jgi:hypothetical protein
LGTGLSSGLGRRVGAGFPVLDPDQQAVYMRTTVYVPPLKQVSTLLEPPCWDKGRQAEKALASNSMVELSSRVVDAERRSDLKEASDLKRQDVAAKTRESEREREAQNETSIN